jgi:hypothetical protein
MVIVAALAADCRLAGVHLGGDGGAGAGAPSGAGAASIRVDPASARLTISNGRAATQQFRAIERFADGHEEDVTDSATWSTDDARRATVSPGGLATTSTASGGGARVIARVGDNQSSAALTIVIEAAATSPLGAPPLPAAPAAVFGGPDDPARAPELVYPNDGVVLPPNLGRVEIHFRPGNPANSLYEIAFANDVTDVRVYTRCVPLADGCVYETTPDIWSSLAQTNGGGGKVSLTVRGTDDAGSAVGTSASFAVRWSRDPLRGALYYWTTTTPVGILRWNFGDDAQTSPEKIVDPQSGDGQCLGCHALSRDGAKMVMTSGADNVGQLLLFDPVKKAALQPFPLPGRSWFESWSPDGGAFVGVNGAGGFADLLLFDGVTGAQTGLISLGGAQATHPDWSPDGARILFTDVGLVHDDQTPGMGGISYVERQGGAWSGVQRLVPAQPGLNRYYPTVAPDGGTVVFNESTCPPGSNYDIQCDADVDLSARLWAVEIPGPGRPAAPPVELAAANAGGVADLGERDLTTTYARWSPFAFNLSETQGLYWVSFSSSRRYGLRAPTTAGNHHDNPSGVLIWMAAVDPQRLAAGQDGSFPAFCLPFQALDTSNHIAQWASGVPTVP